MKRPWGETVVVNCGGWGDKVSCSGRLGAVNGFGRAGYVVVVLGVTQRRLLEFEQPSLFNTLMFNKLRSTAR